MLEIIGPDPHKILGYLAGLCSRLIGNVQSNICITSHDGMKWSLTNCMFEALQELNFKNPYFTTLEEIIGNYHRKYYTGCQAVLFLSNYLLEELLCLKSDYYPNIITSAVSQCLEKEVVYHANKFSTSFDILNIKDLRQLCFNLMKGHDIQIQRAIFRIILLQTNNLEKKGKACFSLKNMTLLHKSGSVGFKLGVYDGIIVKQEINCCCWSKNISRRTVLLKGNLTKRYRHLGHTMASDCTAFQTFTSSSDYTKLDNDLKSENWLSNLIKAIEKFKINTILITGSADPYFLELCKNKLDLTCLTFIPLDILKILALEMESHVLESMADCWSEECITESIGIEEEILQGSYYRIYCDAKKDLFQSVVFSHVTEEWCKVKEEEFLHCAKKLEFSLKDPKNCVVVDGSGLIERNMACHLVENADGEEKRLSSISQNNMSDIHVLRHVLVPRSIAKVLLKYHEVVQNNLSFSDGDDNGFHNVESFNYELCCNACPNDYKPNETSSDNLEIKLASWRTAVYIACLFLKIDFAVLRKEA